MQRERTTLSEVATKAGVSTSTVSLVLAGKADARRIPEETIERVRLAADELDYVPNLLTRSLRKGRTHILSFYSSFRNREPGDLYMDSVAAAVEAAGGAYGYDVLVHCNYRRSVRETYHFLSGGMADGLLFFAPAPDDPLLAMLRRSSLPVVLMNSRDSQGRYPSVSDAGDAAVEDLAAQLLAMGHRRIGAIGTSSSYVRDSRHRLAVFEQALRVRGAQAEIHWTDGDDDIERVLRGPLPTVFFVWHDWLAYRVLEACGRLGIRVPGDVSVVGYDGIHWPSTSEHVCTSLEVDLRTIAMRAVDLLDQSIQQPELPVRHETIPVRLGPGTTLDSPSSPCKEAS